MRHFLFEAQDVERLSFTPGQFLSFTDTVGGKKVTRAYSIASPPGGNRFELCLNRVKEGVFSPHLFELRPGDSITVKGPYGAFILRNPACDSLFVATGTGVAPFRSMLKDSLPRDSSRAITLLFGVRYEAGLLYREEFEALAAAHAGFRFHPTLTRPEPSWRGRTGRVQEHLEETIGERRDLDVYICGLKEMVIEVRERLQGLGFDRKRIIYERYS